MKYYVYELVNPMDGNPFYIGKGSGKRMYVHEFRAKRPHAEINENKKLRNKIKSILNGGRKIVYHQIFFTDDALEAYSQETKRIIEIGIENLCNRFIFPPTKDEIYKIIAMKRLGYKTSEKTKQKISQSLKGHDVSDDTRRKISLSQIGKQRPCSESRRLSIIKSKIPSGGFPSVISPSGSVCSISVLTDFCKEHNLHLPGMSDLIHGRIKSCKGWRIYGKQ